MSNVVRLVINGFLFVAIVTFDRITKYLALQGSLPQFPLPFVSCNVTMNRGISWGWLHANNTEQFIFISLVIAFIIVLLMFQTYLRWKKNKIVWPYTLVLGGAVSNMIDRVLYGGVIDFIEASCYGWSWPVFNVADIGIVLGISYILLQELRR